MHKLDIARRIHQEVGIPEEEAATLLNWILEFLKTTLRKGVSITIHGFGKLTVRKKRPRKGRNPRTGEAVTISARRVVTFHSSPLLRADVNAVPKEQ
jgi:integration host factor subunit alpha